MEITYDLGFEAHLEHKVHEHRKHSIPDFFLLNLLTVLLCGLGAVISYQAGSNGLLAAFVLVAALSLFEANRRLRQWEDVRLDHWKTYLPDHVHLLINDKGIQETSNGEVVMYAPWSAIGFYEPLDQVWVFHLAAAHTLLVPTSALTAASPTALDDLKALLQHHDIPPEE